jgi:hypothetical protein
MSFIVLGVCSRTGGIITVLYTMLCNIGSWTAAGPRTVLGVRPSVLIYIYLNKNQQVHQDGHFIVMLSQMLLHVSAHQHHHQGARMI